MLEVLKAVPGKLGAADWQDIKIQELTRHHGASEGQRGENQNMAVSVVLSLFLQAVLFCFGFALSFVHGEYRPPFYQWFPTQASSGCQ